MAQEETALSTSSAEVPAFMREVDIAEVNELMAQYVRPPRIKIVQGQARPPISEMFSAGDVIFVPTNVLVAEKEKPFIFVPLFFYPEWLVFNPLGAETTIRDRSLDPTSDIAIKSRLPETRKEPWPENPNPDPKKPKYVSYREHLNFICALEDAGELTGVQFAVSFSQSEHKTGMTLSSSIKMRGVPMFGTRWQAKTSLRTNSEGNWYGLDITPAKDNLVRDEELFNQYHASFIAYKEQHANRLIVVSHDDSSAGEDEATTEF